MARRFVTVDLDNPILPPSVVEASELAKLMDIPAPQDLSQLALKSELPDVSGFLTEQDLPAPPDLTPFALKTEALDPTAFASAAQGALADTAVQPSQLPTRPLRIQGSAYFQTASRSYPPMVRTPEPGRGRLVVRNMGTTNVNVVLPLRVIANYNSPGWTGAVIIPEGKELVVDGGTGDVFIGPDADGTVIKVRVFAEVSI